MDGHVEDRTATWLGFVRELVQEPMVEFPVDAISRALASTFDVTGVSWNWRRADGSFGLSITPRSLLHQGEGWELWEEGKLFDIHPLVLWHLVTSDSRPQTFSRVPRSLVARQDREFIRRLLRTFGADAAAPSLPASAAPVLCSSASPRPPRTAHSTTTAPDELRLAT